MVKCRKGKKQQQFLVVYLPKRDCFSSRWKYAGSRCTSGWEEIKYYCHLNVSFQSYERIWPAKTTISFLFQVFYTFLLAVFVSSFNLLSYMAKRLKLCIFTKWIYLSISSVHLLLFSWVYHYFKLIYVSGIASLCTRSFHRSYRFFLFSLKIKEWIQKQKQKSRLESGCCKNRYKSYKNPRPIDLKSVNSKLQQLQNHFQLV